MEINNNLKEGDVVEGRVTGVQPYGIFIKLNNECSGLIHVTELAKIESGNPSRFFRVGQILKVRIIKIKAGGKQAVLKVHRTRVNKRRISASDFETNSGFDSIKRQLPIWIQDAKDNDYEV